MTTPNKFWITASSKKTSASDVSKNYVDKKCVTLSANINTRASKFGDAFSGDLNMNDNKITTDYIPVSECDVVNKKYVDTTILSKDVNKVNKAGDMMTGDLTLGENKLRITYIPTLDDDAVTKKYVDFSKQKAFENVVHGEYFRACT